MRDIGAELKELRLHGMVSAWADLHGLDENALAASRWLVEHLLQPSTAGDRHIGGKWWSVWRCVDGFRRRHTRVDFRRGVGVGHVF